MDKAGSYGIQAAGGQVPLSLIFLQKCQTKIVLEPSAGIVCMGARRQRHFSPELLRATRSRPSPGEFFNDFVSMCVSRKSYVVVVSRTW